MAPKTRLTWAEMDHNDELLLERIVRRSSGQERGPIPEFLAKKQAEQEPKTWLGYRTSLTKLTEFMGPDATVGEFTEAIGHSFLTTLRDRDLSRNTIATYFRDLKTFSRWMFDKGWTEEDRWARLKRPKFVRPKFDTLSSDDKQTILADFNPNTFLGARNLAVLSIFLDTGVRLEELVNIQTQRVRLDAGYVEVYADKTDEWRIIPISPETIEICQHYLRIREEFLEKPVRHRDHRRTQRTLQTDTFFCSWRGEQLTENGVGQMVRRLRARLGKGGMDVHIHPHLFRHNFLTEKALDGENPSIVRRWAGHKSYEMTDYYFGLADQKMAAIRPKRSSLAGISPLRKKPGRKPGDRSNIVPLHDVTPSMKDAPGSPVMRRNGRPDKGPNRVRAARSG
ncbi:MAG: tyrosine-type recombinase/integrase [Chloroflexota bacterium]